MFLKELVAKNLILARKNFNYSLQNFADSLGVAKNTIFRWEKLEREIDFDNLEKIANFLGLSPIWFFQNHDEQKDVSAYTGCSWKIKISR